MMLPSSRSTSILAGAPAIGISVKCGSVIETNGGKEYLCINLSGHCHKQLPRGVDHRRSILDAVDGALAGLLQSPLPSGDGSHADSMLLYVVSTAPGVRIALLSKVPMMQLQELIPADCQTDERLKVPLDRKDKAWSTRPGAPSLYDAFVDVECKLAALGVRAYYCDMHSAFHVRV